MESDGRYLLKFYWNSVTLNIVVFLQWIIGILIAPCGIVLTTLYFLCNICTGTISFSTTLHLFCIDVTFEREEHFTSHLFNDKLKVIARDFISERKEGEKSKEAEGQRKKMFERQTVAVERHSIGNNTGS